MDIQTLTSFFMWCTILNTGMLVFLGLVFMLAPDLAYRLQSRFISISRQTFDTVFYSLMAFYKTLVIVFNLVPWIALLIIA